MIATSPVLPPSCTHHPASSDDSVNGSLCTSETEFVRFAMTEPVPSLTFRDLNGNVDCCYERLGTFSPSWRICLIKDNYHSRIRACYICAWILSSLLNVDRAQQPSDQLITEQLLVLQNGVCTVVTATESTLLVENLLLPNWN